MKTKMTPEQKEQIDKMTHAEMAYKWRFGAIGNPLFQGETGEYFSQRMKELGGMTPQISKAIGWEK